jgi:hypothetical protein
MDAPTFTPILRLLRQQVQALMAGVEINPRRCMHALSAHGFEEVHGFGDGIDDLLIRLAQRRVTQETQIPILRVMQIRETTVDQRPHEIQGQRSSFVTPQQQFRIRLTLRGAETGSIDVVAAVRGQRQAAARLGIRRTRLGILPRESADAQNRLLQSLQQDQTHLQQYLQAPGDIVGLAVLETLGAIAALKQELLAALRLRQLRGQRLDFPGDHQRR